MFNYTVEYNKEFDRIEVKLSSVSNPDKHCYLFWTIEALKDSFYHKPFVEMFSRINDKYFKYNRMFKK